MNINSNKFTVYFKSDIIVKLSPWFCGWIESTFYVYLPFILLQFVTRVEYCAHVWMSSAESHLGLLDSVTLNKERLCDCELYCLEHRRCLLYKIYHLVDHSMNKYLHYFASARFSFSFSERVIDLVISRCRTNRLCRWLYLMLFVGGACCHRVYLVVAPWAS